MRAWSSGVPHQPEEPGRSRVSIFVPKYLKAVIAANGKRISESVRVGEEQLASGEPPLKTLDEVDAPPLNRRRKNDREILPAGSSLMKTCMCCGFTSDNYRLFMKTRHNWPYVREDDWICRSEAKCVERTDNCVDKTTQDGVGWST